MMAASKDVADVIADGLGKGLMPDAVAASAYEAIWSEQNQAQRDFAIFGGEFLMELDVAGLRGWFQGFFNLPEDLWAGFLAGWPSLPGNQNHESWVARLTFGLQLVTKIPPPIALKLIAGIARFSLTYGVSLIRSVTPLFGTPPSYAWTPPVPKEEVGDVAAKTEAFAMMKAGKETSKKRDWTVPVSRMKLQLRRMQVLNGDQINELLNYLDDAGIGTISYRPFRTAVAEFLAISRDFHSALSPEEFTAILCRIQDRLQRTGMTFTEAVREAEGKNSLAGAQFMQSLRNLRLGLSNKEVAQIFNSLSANSFRIAGTTHLPNPVQNGQVSVVLFEALLDKSTMDNRLQDWAMAAFPRLREILGTEQAVQTALRQHAEPPLRQYLPFTGFVALVTDADPSITSAEISKLWCVLEKDDFSDEPLVRFEEFLHWINAEAPKVKGKKPEYGLFA
eukprot:symbB.v1.2.010036.t1/scaffold650.1/size176305/15